MIEKYRGSDPHPVVVKIRDTGKPSEYHTYFVKSQPQQGVVEPRIVTLRDTRDGRSWLRDATPESELSDEERRALSVLTVHSELHDRSRF